MSRMQRRREAEARAAASGIPLARPLPQAPSAPAPQGQADLPGDPLPVDDAEEGWAPPVWQLDQPHPPHPPAPAGGWAQEVPRSRASNGPYAVVLAVCVLALLAMLFFVLKARAPLAAFKQRQHHLAQQVFFEGIQVDGTDIGGLTRAQARDKLDALAQQRDEALEFTLHADGRSYIITGAQLPFTRNVEAVLDRAWAVGRQGFPWMIGSDMTPFQVRWEHTRQARATGMPLYTETSWQPQDVEKVADWLAGQIRRDPINAVIATFDFGTKAFTVTQDVPGVTIEAEEIAKALTQALEGGSLRGDIHLKTEAVLPKVTSVELQNSFIMLSSFSTQTTRDEKRNDNIALAARAIDGTTLMPGETFSFNKTVGERTAQKGYQVAPAIAGGATADEIGGGVCQVSSTLLNAAAMADMQIVDRTPHAWPSSYVDMGLDATVNWPGLDFQFKNPKATPVFIVARYKDRQMLVEVYGMRTGPGESVELATELMATHPPPKEPDYQRNTSLAPGTQRELKASRTGYVVDTYRVYLRGGKEYRREKLFTSTYPMVRQVIEYN